MQLFGLVGVVALAALISISGFQVVPESATNRAAASTTDSGVGFAPGVPMIRTSPTSATGDSDNASNTSVPVFQPSTLTALAAQNIEAASALLRGEVTVGSEELSNAFFIYGYSRTDVNESIAANKTYQAVVVNKRVEASVVRAARTLRQDQQITARVRNLAPDTTYYVRLCAERAEQLLCSPTSYFTTIPGAYSPGEVRLPSIRVTDESAAAADELTIAVTVDMRDTIDGDVYLIYGESQGLVEAARNTAYNQISEDDELLQTTRLIRLIRGTQRLTKTVDDLSGDTQIYYAVCVAYDGLLDGRVCTRTQQYTTYNEDYGTSPQVVTTGAVLDSVSARLSGRVRMRDFSSGKVFFIYGSDLERITTAPGEVSMERLRQTQDRFQRVLVDSDLDGNDAYTTTIRDLQPDTLYAARLCVEYENQNERYRQVPFVSCGELRSFKTQ